MKQVVVQNIYVQKKLKELKAKVVSNLNILLD